MTHTTTSKNITWKDMIPFMEKLKNMIEDSGMLNLPENIVEDSADIFSNITEEEWNKMTPYFKDIEAIIKEYFEFDRIAPYKGFYPYGDSRVMNELDALIFDLKFKRMFKDREVRAFAIERVHRIKEIHGWLKYTISDIKEYELL